MPFDSPHFKDIIRYYDKTRFDYRVAWDNSEFPAQHFGMYEEGVDNHKDALQNTNRILADIARVEAGNRVLDAGCGKGGSSLWLTQNRQAQTVGITLAKSQLKDCRAKAKLLGLEEHCEFMIADYCQTPFESASFDVVWACESQCYALNKADFYREAYRLLKPGGRLVVADYIRNDRPLGEEEEKILHRWLKGWAIKDIDTAAEHQDHAQKAGFDQLNIADYTPQTWVSLRNLYNNSRSWIWVSRLMLIFGLRTRVQHQNQLSSIDQFIALKSNLWKYVIISAEK
ncbi:MAG: methyltransferase domain-containing protein [Bacteroidota bacterium]